MTDIFAEDFVERPGARQRKARTSIFGRETREPQRSGLDYARWTVNADADGRDD